MLRCFIRLKNWAFFAGFVTVFGSAVVCSFLFAISIRSVGHDPGSDDSLTLATWVLAFATILQWLVVTVQAFLFIWQLRLIEATAREAENTSRTAATQAQAIIKANSPIPVIAELKLVTYESWRARDGLTDRVNPGDPVPEFCRVLPRIINIGRHSLRVTSFCIERQAIEGPLPEQPNYLSVDNNWQPWLLPSQDLWFRPADNITALDFSNDDREAVNAGRKTLWIFGYFTYLNVVEETLTHKFMVRWDLVHGLVGERQANYA